MATHTVRMAKATMDDIDAAMTVSSIIEGLHKGYYPKRNDDDPTHFDEDDPDHLRALYDRLVELTQPVGGGLFRVAGGMHVILTNDILDPDDDCLALHPRLRTAPANGVERIHIKKPEKLDPITVYLEDYGKGRGRAVIVCYCTAWTCSWGGMGERPVREFIASCDEHYIGGCMTSMSHHRVTKAEREYAKRVARAVISHISAGAGGGVADDRCPDGLSAAGTGHG